MKLTAANVSLILLALSINPVHATTPTSADAARDLKHTADRYAMDAKQYRAAGKPTALFLARYYDDLSSSYRQAAARLLTAP